MSRNNNEYSLLEKLASKPYKYKVGPFGIESPIKLKPPIKRKDTRAFFAASGVGYLASKYNRSRINNGQEVGNLGRFMAENPGSTMLAANVMSGLGMAGKNVGQDKWQSHKINKANKLAQTPAASPANNVKMAEEKRSEFEKFASSGFLTSQETQDRFLENHKPSELAMVKLAFALEACGELDRIDGLMEKGGRKVLDEYIKVAYDVCSEGIEKEAGRVRRAVVNGIAGFMSGGATNLTGSIPNAIASSAVDRVYGTASRKGTGLAQKGLDAGIDKMLDFEDKIRGKKNPIAPMNKVASYDAFDARAEVDKIDQAFFERDATTKASETADQYEKIATEKEALASLLGGRVASFIRDQKAFQEIDDCMNEDDVSGIGLEDEMKLANDSKVPEDSLEAAVESMDLEEPIELGDHDKDDDSIWSEDPVGLIE